MAEIRYGTAAGSDGKDFFIEATESLPDPKTFGKGTLQRGLEFYTCDGDNFNPVGSSPNRTAIILFGDSIIAGGNALITGASAIKLTETTAQVTASNHALSPSNLFWFSGATEASGVGLFTVQSVIDANNFIATVPSDFPNVVPSTGSTKTIVIQHRLNDRNYIQGAIAELLNVSERVYNFGSQGMRIDQILPVFYRELMARRPKIAYLGAGTNDVLQLRNYADIAADIVNAISIGAKNCDNFLVATLPPIGPSAGSFASSMPLAVTRLNKLIRTEADKYSNVSVIDIFGHWTQATTHDYITTFSSDDVHPNGAATQKTLSIVKPLLATMIKPTEFRASLLLDRNLTDSSNDQLNRNAIMDGTSGTVLNEFVGQQVADSYTLTSTGTFSTKSATKETRSDGRGFNQVIAVTGASSGAVVDLLATNFSSILAGGETLRSFFDVEIVSATAINTVNIYLEVIANGITYVIPTSAYSSSGSYSLTNTWRRYLSTMPFVVPTGTITTARQRVQVNLASGGAVTLKVGCLSVERT